MVPRDRGPGWTSALWQEMWSLSLYGESHDSAVQVGSFCLAFWWERMQRRMGKISQVTDSYCIYSYIIYMYLCTNYAWVKCTITASQHSLLCNWNVSIGDDLWESGTLEDCYQPQLGWLVTVDICPFCGLLLGIVTLGYPWIRWFIIIPTPWLLYVMWIY